VRQLSLNLDGFPHKPCAAIARRIPRKKASLCNKVERCFAVSHAMMSSITDHQIEGAMRGTRSNYFIRRELQAQHRRLAALSVRVAIELSSRSRMRPEQVLIVRLDHAPYATPPRFW
jgi:hypothetical protein